MAKKNIWSRDHLEKRVVGKQHAVTVPVDVTIEPKHRILDLSEMTRILESADLIAQQECYCRKTMKNCIEPMDGCFSLNENGTLAIEKWGATKITVEEALAALERTHKAGLVHMAYTFKENDEPGMICSCCSCCCDTLTAALEFKYPDLVFRAHRIEHTDMELCTGCGVCVDRCQFSARSLVEGKLMVEPELCFGCGVCVSMCPTGAISLVDRTS